MGSQWRREASGDAAQFVHNVLFASINFADMEVLLQSDFQLCDPIAEISRTVKYARCQSGHEVHRDDGRETCTG